MNVVIAYPGFGDIKIETEILRAAGLAIEHVGTTDSEEARQAARQCDALMVTIQPVDADLIQSLAALPANLQGWYGTGCHRHRGGHRAGHLGYVCAGLFDR